MILIEPRLKISLWVSALIRRAQSAGAFAVVMNKGDPDSGAALINVRSGDGRHRLYTPAQGMDGSRIWLVSEAEDESIIAAKLAKRLARDTDLWVVEIEDKGGRHFLTEPIETLKPREN